MPLPSVQETSDAELTYTETARELNVTVRTVHRLRSEGLLTPVVRRTLRGGRRVRFRRSEVDALLAQTVAGIDDSTTNPTQ